MTDQSAEILDGPSDVVGMEGAGFVTGVRRTEYVGGFLVTYGVISTLRRHNNRTEDQEAANVTQR